MLAVLTVRVELPEPVTEAGLKFALAPPGSPLVTLKLTVPVNPFTAPIVAVYVVLLACVTLWEDGVAAMVKSGVVEPQVGNLNDASRVAQLKLPVFDRYSLLYQNVQSSTGSMAILV